MNIPRTQLGQKSFPSTELSVHQSSLPPRDLQNFVMGGSLNPSNGRDFRQESFEHDNMSLKFSSDPQNHPNELSEITFGRRSPAILSSNRSSSSSPVESLAVASQRCQQRPPRKRREIGPRGQSAFTIGRLTAGSQFRVTTSAPSRLLPALNPQDSVSSSDDETGHSSGPQRQSSSRPAAEHQGNSQFDRLFQGSKWKKMKVNRR